ncbi:6-phosphogluconolactonase [Euzebya sp.]|uniref:6-phosphogluconolactonase n=1 Tax=Euzebya sp. TaxID=1971409 RepID=UPI0035140809
MPTELAHDDAPELEVHPDAAAVTARVCDLVVGWLRSALDARGSAVLALSGGSTPVPLYIALAGADVDWPRVHVVQVDERLAPAGDPARNWTAIATSLVDPTGATGHPMPVEAADPIGAAGAYATRIAALGGLDVAHLGLGDDGHTASLVPGDPVVDSTARIDLSGVYRGHQRMTMTAPAINAARWVVWQVSGPGKSAALQALLDGHPPLPAHRIRRDAVVVADAEAAR